MEFSSLRFSWDLGFRVWDFGAMDVFITGLVVLFVATAIFFIVLFSFIFYWHLKRISYIVVPMVFAFEFFLMGFFVVSLVAIILQFLPELIRNSGVI